MKRGRDEEGEGGVANCLMLLSKVGESVTNPFRERELKAGGGAFKCKTCNRQFLSFQALGGHRASHKKVKLMGAHLSYHQKSQLPSSLVKPKMIKMHPCPICGIEFAIGQALGGHMRKHRGAINDGSLIHDHAVPNLKKSNGAANSKRFDLCLDLDLNLTPSEDDHLKLSLNTPVLKCFI